MKLLTSLLISAFVFFCPNINNEEVTLDASRPTIFSDSNYNGHQLNIHCSEPDLHDNGWGDILSSCYVPDGWRIVFYEHTNYQGARFTVSGDVSHFSSYNWNDTPSSMKIYFENILQNDCVWISNKDAESDNRIKCPRCKGHGEISLNGGKVEYTCPRCNGDRYIY